MVECSDLCRILYINIIQKHFNCIYLQNFLVKISRHSPEQICHPHQNCISGTWFAEDLCDLAVFVLRADTGPMMNHEFNVLLQGSCMTVSVNHALETWLLHSRKNLHSLNNDLLLN